MKPSCCRATYLCSGPCLGIAAIATLLVLSVSSRIGEVCGVGGEGNMVSVDKQEAAYAQIKESLGRFDTIEPDIELASLIRACPEVAANVVRDVLGEEIDRANSMVVANALGLAARLDKTRATPLSALAARHLKSRVPNTRIVAIRATAHCGGHRYISAIILLLDDPEFNVRYRAMEALGQIGRKEDLVGLELWLERTRRADEQRQAPWLQGAMLGAIERAREQMAERGQESNSAAEEGMPSTTRASERKDKA